MRSSLSFAAAIISLPITAQIIINGPDMPSVGDTVRYQTTALLNFDGADTGPAYSWDFSTATPMAEAADTVVAVSSTPFLYQFFFNNPILYPDHVADHALRGAGFDFQVLTVTDLFDYYRIDNDGFRNVGFGANINGLPSSTRRIPVDKVYTFPLQYTDQDMSFSSFEISVPGLLYFQQDQWRTNEVDGWGTVITPAGTYDCLRLKSTLQRTDTAYINQIGQGFSIPEPETVEYKWLANGQDGPVFQVTTVGGVPTLVRYRQAAATAVSELQHAAALLTIHPSPVNENLQINWTDLDASAMQIVDMQGRVILAQPIGQRSGTLRMDVSALPNGKYLLIPIGIPQAARSFVVHH